MDAYIINKPTLLIHIIAHMEMKRKDVTCYRVFVKIHYLKTNKNTRRFQHETSQSK